MNKIIFWFFVIAFLLAVYIGLVFYEEYAVKEKYFFLTKRTKADVEFKGFRLYGEAFVFRNNRSAVKKKCFFILNYKVGTTFRLRHIKFDKVDLAWSPFSCVIIERFDQKW